jgi:hypothetical protein
MGAFCGKGGWIQSFGSSVRGVVLKESSLGLPAEGDLIYKSVWTQPGRRSGRSDGS